MSELPSHRGVTIHLRKCISMLKLWMCVIKAPNAFVQSEHQGSHSVCRVNMCRACWSRHCIPSQRACKISTCEDISRPTYIIHLHFPVIMVKKFFRSFQTPEPQNMDILANFGALSLLRRSLCFSRSLIYWKINFVIFKITCSMFCSQY